MEKDLIAAGYYFEASADVASQHYHAAGQEPFHEMQRWGRPARGAMRRLFDGLLLCLEASTEYHVIIRWRVVLLLAGQAVGCDGGEGGGGAARRGGRGPALHHHEGRGGQRAGTTTTARQTRTRTAAPGPCLPARLACGGMRRG